MKINQRTRTRESISSSIREDDIIYAAGDVRAAMVTTARHLYRFKIDMLQMTRSEQETFRIAINQMLKDGLEIKC